LMTFIVLLECVVIPQIGGTLENACVSVPRAG
jgi:hypothetical protein